MSEVPDYVPMLCKGLSDNPKEGGCLVQIANWLVDPETWTDDPICVHHVLADVSVFINDNVDDVQRRRLALLAPALGNTIPETRGQEMTFLNGLMTWRESNPQPRMISEPKTTERHTPDGVEMFIEITLSYKDGGAAVVDWLFAYVSEANRLLGRETRPLTEQEGTALRALMNQ